MEKRSVGAFQIGAVFIGTVIGAGFASGQEILQFFTRFGKTGILLLFLTGVVFSAVGYAVFYIAERLRLYNYKDFICGLYGEKMAILFDMVITLFLFIGAAIMFSGSGALFSENLNLPKSMGIAVIGFLTLVTVLNALDGVLRINSFIIPVTFSIIVMVFAANALSGGMVRSIELSSRYCSGNIAHAVLYFLFYCAYNLMLSLGVLTALPRKFTSHRTLFQGAVIGGTGLMLLGMLINLCLLHGTPDVFDYSIPSLFVVKNYPALFRIMIMVCIWCEIFSTAVSNIFGLTVRLSSGYPHLYKIITILTVAACMPFAFYDFKRLIAFFYPIFGALSLALMPCILYTFFKLRQRQPGKKKLKNVFEQ